MTETFDTIETPETPDVTVEPRTPFITSNDIAKTVVLALLGLAVQQSAVAVENYVIPKLAERREARKAKKANKAAENATLVGVK